MKSKNSSKKIVPVAAAALAILVVVGLAVTAGRLLAMRSRDLEEVQKKADQARTEAVPDQSAEQERTYKGKTYEYNRSLTNILFLGIDKTQEVTIQDTPGLGGQADSIMILSLDETSKTGKILQISRDAMTKVDLYDASGNYFTSVEAQIATQYAYGNGEKSSCWATEKAVGRLLQDLPIDAYLSLNIDGICALTDAAGGVTLTMDQNYTAIDPAFTKGASVKLTGEQAERYVRYRDQSRVGGNNGRMERQVQYITALVETLKHAVGDAGNYYERFASYLEPYMVTDMDGEQINDLAHYEFQANETQYVPGEVTPGEEHEEFHVNEEQLTELLLEMFYKPKR